MATTTKNLKLEVDRLMAFETMVSTLSSITVENTLIAVEALKPENQKSILKHTKMTSQD